ncbi:unnamed protein product [Prorocentrum cordatum]|uniref:PX domain-containing protein n=1 Tax=Prorocentrum cordatum TaxID=2364126 RepID=A0ABN9SB10_9DINO|nr:unnamed protein product [Polarella glacialis]
MSNRAVFSSAFSASALALACLWRAATRSPIYPSSIAQRLSCPLRPRAPRPWTAADSCAATGVAARRLATSPRAAPTAGAPVALTRTTAWRRALPRRPQPQLPLPPVAGPGIPGPACAVAPALAAPVPVVVAAHAVTPALAVPVPVVQAYAVTPTAPVPVAAGAPSGLPHGCQPAGGTVEVQAAGYSEPERVGFGKAFRTYFFVVSAAGVREQVGFRFSALRAAHEQASPSGVQFPSRHVFWDMAKEENARARSAELLRYLQSLLNGADVAEAGRLTLQPRLCQALGCSPALAEVLQAVGRARREDHQRRLQEQAAQLAAIRQQQLTDRDFAQRVNHQGTALTMFYPRRLSFELRAKMFSWRDQVNITGPGGFDWFCMLRASSLFSLRDTEVIANLSGEPLLALHRQFSWMHYRYRLERVGLAGLRMPLCSITRHNNLFSAVQYDIQMEAMTFGGMIHCQGQWFEDFVLYQGGGPACRIKKRPWTFPEVYDVTIEQGYDVLLLLGIACAIDHIHHEVEESRRR